MFEEKKEEGGGSF